MPNNELITSQPPGQSFPWPQGTRLVALDEVILAIPAAIMGDDEETGSVIHGDAQMEIKLPMVPMTTPGALIYLRLSAGMTVWLKRSCHAVVVADDKKPRRIRVIPRPKESSG